MERGFVIRFERTLGVRAGYKSALPPPVAVPDSDIAASGSPSPETSLANAIHKPSLRNPSGRFPYPEVRLNEHHLPTCLAHGIASADRGRSRRHRAHHQELSYRPRTLLRLGSNLRRSIGPIAACFLGRGPIGVASSRRHRMGADQTSSHAIRVLGGSDRTRSRSRFKCEPRGRIPPAPAEAIRH